MMQCHTAAQAICDVVVFREPTLAEMLSDPVIHAVMQADGVDPDYLRALMAWMKRQRGSSVERRNA